MLELRTLGFIEVRGEDGASVASVVLHPKRIALLAYLCACHPPRSHRRDTLIGLLWPEQDEEHGRGALRQELHRLRQALGPDVVRGDRADAIWIDCERLRCDAQQFEAALSEGRRAEALALWQGEFLPGLHVDGGEFERWLDDARERLRRHAVEAARQLMMEAEDDRDGAAALSWARRLTELAPYDEGGWRELILLLDHQGERAAALQAYDALSARLRGELEVEPSPETRSLVERVRGRGEAFATEGNGPPNTSRSAARHESRLSARAVIELRPVENLTGEAALDALARRITDRLAQGLADAMFVDVAAPGSAAGATVVVSATLYRRGELLEIVPRIAEAGEGGRLVEMPRTVTLSADGPDDRLQLQTAHVLASLAAHYDPRFDAAATRERALPIPTPLWEAYLEFLRGSEQFGRYQFAEGYRHLLRAFEIDPDFVKAGFFAAIAAAYTGQIEEAESLLRRALALERPLSDYERGGCEWLLASLHGRRAEAYRAAVESSGVSSHPLIPFLAAREALFMNRPREALRLMEGVDFWQGWWRNWTEYFEILGGAWHLLGNHRAELALALQGRARFPGSLETIRAEARARAALGESERVSALVDEALTLPAGLTSPAHVAWVAAQELAAHGAETTATRLRRVALEWLAGIPEPSPPENHLRVRLLLETGDAFGAARALAGLGPPADLESLELAGLTAAHLGDVAAARQALAALEGLQNPYLSGRHLLAAAGIRAVLDPPDVAIATLRRALAAGLPFGVELHALPALQPIVERAEFRALLRPRE